MGCKRKNLGWAVKEMGRQLLFSVVSASLFFLPAVVLYYLVSEIASWVYIGVAFMLMLCLALYALCDTKSRE
jgi:hypothetical protein